MGKLIYVAGQYSGDIENNIKKAEKVSIALIRNGWYVFTPHKNTAGYEKYEDDKITYRTWMEMDLNILRRCDAVYVMQGWMDSRGAIEEIALAIMFDMPIFWEDYVSAIDLKP